MSAVPEISIEAARERLDSFRIVDVREANEFEGPLGHIAGATLVPLGTLEQAAGSLPKDRPLLAVCRSGRRSETACEILAAHGLEATNLIGGMIAWNRAGLPIERRAPANPVELRDAIAAWFAQLSGSEITASRAAIERAFAEEGASWDAPSPAGLDVALARIEAALSRDSRPPDLDISLAFFREVLAMF